MTKLVAVVLAMTAAVGCGKKKSDAGGEHPGSAGKGSGSGSNYVSIPNPPPGPASEQIAGSGSDPLGSGTGMEGSSALKQPQTDADRAKYFEDCWAKWSDGRFDAFGNCYALDAKSEAPGSGQKAADSRAAIVEQAKGERAASPDQKGDLELELVSGQAVIAIARIGGSINGKAFGIQAGVISEFGEHGDIAHEQTYLDAATIQAQVSGTAGARPAVTQATPHEVVIAKADNTEKANQEVIRKLADAFGKHDAAAYGALVADGVVWSDDTLAKDDTKATLLASTKKLWGGVADARIDLLRTWAAGDYVAVEETLDGTQGGNGFSVPALVVYKLAGGKVAQAWLFYQKAAMAPGGGSAH